MLGRREKKGLREKKGRRGEDAKKTQQTENADRRLKRDKWRKCEVEVKTIRRRYTLKTSPVCVCVFECLSVSL